MTSLKDFYNMLKKHDWYYAFSDDMRTYNSGESVKNKLKNITGESPEHKALYEGFENHYFSGKSFGTEKQELPEEPKEENV